jgi:hypothetical protein
LPPVRRAWLCFLSMPVMLYLVCNGRAMLCITARRLLRDEVTK